MKNTTKKCLISLAVLIGVVLAIVAMFVTIVKTTSTLTSYKVVYQIFDEGFNEISDVSRALMAFTIITAILSVIVFALSILEAMGVFNSRKIRTVVALLLIVCAIIAFALSFVFASDIGGFSAGSVEVKSSPAIGAYLAFFGGLVAGVAGMFKLSNKGKRKRK